MKKIITIMLFFAVFLASAQTISVGTAINKAGKQRMLCFKIAKNYLSIGSGVKTEESLREIDDAASTFNENYSDLMIFIKDKETKIVMEEIGKIWTKFRLKVLNTPEENDASALISEANALAGMCNIVVDKVVANSGLKAAVLPNICGKERMLSQKMAMYFMASYWKIPYAGLNKELADTIASFEINLNMLLTSTSNTDEINTILKLQKDEWTFLKKSYDLTAESQMPSSVLSSSNLMLKNFDRATGLYEKLLN